MRRPRPPPTPYEAPEAATDSDKAPEAATGPYR
jgi:hypothetical protein